MPYERAVGVRAQFKKGKARSRPEWSRLRLASAKTTISPEAGQKTTTPTVRKKKAGRAPKDPPRVEHRRVYGFNASLRPLPARKTGILREGTWMTLPFLGLWPLN